MSESNDDASQLGTISREVRRIKNNMDKKLSKEEQEMEENITKFDGLQSIYSLVELYPNKFKDMLDKLVQ